MNRVDVAVNSYALKKGASDREAKSNGSELNQTAIAYTDSTQPDHCPLSSVLSVSKDFLLLLPSLNSFIL